MRQRNSTTVSSSNQKPNSDKRRNSVTADSIFDTLKRTIAEYYPDEQKNKFHNYMNGRFLDQVLYFETHEDENSSFYTRLKVALVVLSALTSLSVGLEAIFPTSTALKIIALVLTLFVTVFSTVLTTFNFQEKSIVLQQYRERLITQFYRFHQRIPPYQSTDGDCESTFITNIENIIGEANKARDGLQKAERDQ